MADAPDLGSGPERGGGSSPLARTQEHLLIVAVAFACGATGFAQSGPDWIRPAALPKPGEPVFFHGEFSVSSTAQRAEFAGACDGSAQVFINGKPAAELKGILRAVNADATSLLRRGKNVLEVRAVNATNTPVLLVKLSFAADAKGKSAIISDGSWTSSTTAATNGVTGEFVTVDWSRVQVLGRAGVPPWGDPFDPTKSFDAYNSWRGSLGTKQATPVENISAPRGYKVELVRSAQDGEGSWISLAFDPQGRLTVAREKSGLLRMTLTPGGGVAKVEVINENLLECRGLLYAHGALYVNANNSKALYRLRSTRGDDTFDEVKLLKATEGGVGHGRNGLTLGPDGKIYFVHGNNVRLPADLAATSPYKNFAEDRLLPCPWDNRLFDSDAKAPCGHIMRTDAEGTRWEIVAGGFRNPYDIAFNADGELFTFDADMEWDVGAPWYRPTRVHHVVSGGEYGWRHGTSMWPTDWPDDLPPLVNVGLSSPTGVKFGTASKFPPKYRRAFFISDWAYGRILAVHLTPKGASYLANFETFLTGRPLNVTDLEFGPDGAMWFTTGGRGTQAGLYRVTYTGPEIREPAMSKAELKAEEDAVRARALRRQLEGFHGKHGLFAVDFAWPHLDSGDARIRFAARLAVEHQDVTLWQQRALNETRPQAALTALTALARCGNKETQPSLLAALDRLSWSKLTDAQRIDFCRAYQLAFIRMGKPDAATAARLATKFDAVFPTSNHRLNADLCELLVYLESSNVVHKTLPLIAFAPTQEEQMQFMFTLRNVARGWTLDNRRAYFKWFDKAAGYTGGKTFPAYVRDIKADAMATLTDAERAALASMLNPPLPKTAFVPPARPRPLVQNWKMEDLLADVSAPLQGRAAKRGRETFTAAQCIACHRFGSEGGSVGPDLSDVGRRFDRRAILESILEPSKVIDDKYRNTDFTLKDGEIVTGQVVRDEGATLQVRPNPLAEQLVRVGKADIKSSRPSAISPMPTGLLDTFTRAEILDLIAFLESGGGGATHSAVRR